MMRWRTYLISNAIDELELHISDAAPAIRGEALANVIADYQTSQKSLQRLTVRYPASVLDALISVEGFKLDQNHDRAYVEQWAEQVRSAVAEIQPSLRPELSYKHLKKNWRMVGKRLRLTCLVSPSMYTICRTVIY